MKRITRSWLCLTLAATVLSGCSLFKSGETAEATDAAETLALTEETRETAPEETTVSSDEADEAESTPLAEEGGNPDRATAREISVTVSEDKYFVDNHELTFDELVEEIGAGGGEAFVRISDENATLNAFEKLRDYLAENEIEYELS
ncbi:MAG: hypothetical protein NC084_12745 [Bacteroides sp.]|nr:hypothetical protein [Eubacterium sp.]MCM1419599.1 hypothetical protein [Roseburia sp.]MCM1463562.1 hypothetical protein [Bacteroides sp.]